MRFKLNLNVFSILLLIAFFFSFSQSVAANTVTLKPTTTHEFNNRKEYNASFAEFSKQYVYGNKLYVASSAFPEYGGYSVVRVFDITNGKTLKKTGQHKLGGNNYLYADNYTFVLKDIPNDSHTTVIGTKLEMIDLSRPKKDSVWTYTFGKYFSINDILVNGIYIYFIGVEHWSDENADSKSEVKFYVFKKNDDNQGYSLIDNLILDNSYSNTKMKFYKYKTSIYITAMNERESIKDLLIFDISNLDKPSLRSVTKLNNYSTNKAMFIGNYALVLSYQKGIDPKYQFQIDVLDISNPESPVAVNSQKLKYIFQNISIVDNFLYVSSTGHGRAGHIAYLDVYDISDPLKFTNTKTYALETPEVMDHPVVFSHETFYGFDIVGDNAQIQVFDVSAPSLSFVDKAFVKKNSGRILVSVESRGEAWYVDPITQKRYFLGSPADALKVMRNRGIGITNKNIFKIPQAGKATRGDMALRKKMAGRILLQVHDKGKAWYVNPTDLKRYYLGHPTDVLRIIKQKGLGISNTNLSKIPISSKSDIPK